MWKIEGEPSQNQGACDTAIRLLKQLEADNARLRGLIKDKEWSGTMVQQWTGDRYRLYGTCIHCNKTPLDSHSPDCPAFTPEGEVDSG
jgi:hypothetical protein